MFGVTVIHTSIGRGLDEMTSAADFHLISWQNFLLLSAVVVGVLIPVGLRYYFKREISTVTDLENNDDIALQEDGDQILAISPISHANKARMVPSGGDDDSDVSSYGDTDEDVILEAGPAVVLKLPTESTSGDVGSGGRSNRTNTVSCAGIVS